MKTLRSKPGTLQPVPAAYTSGVVQPLSYAGGPTTTAVKGTAQRYTEAQALLSDGNATVQRQHLFAADAQRLPVQAVRCQDRRPDSNDGVTITAEAGFPVAPLGSTLR